MTRQSTEKRCLANCRATNQHEWNRTKARLNIFGKQSWEVWLGILLLVVTSIASGWAAAKIFRYALLMTGKRPTLPELIRVLTRLADRSTSENEYVLQWNRDPEEFDLRFLRNGEKLTFEIYQYPTDERDRAERELVFSHEGTVGATVAAFAETFEQLYEDRNTDEFEFNWRQPFPYDEYAEFRASAQG